MIKPKRLLPESLLPSLLPGILLLSIMSCTPKQKEVSTIFRTEEENANTEDFDLPELEQNGEIIAVTLSGPDTYFEFRGQGFGMQYQLAAHFARSKGLRIRMEIAHDTLEMVSKLKNGEADMIILPMNAVHECLVSAVQDSTKHIGWLTRANSPELAKALDAWYRPSIKDELLAEQRKISKNQTKMTARHKPRPKVKDARRGIISDFDELLRRYARTTGWDWRLLAAQCYQESAFDPQAVSWAGAQGLMQLMPSTASHYEVYNTFSPEANIKGATSMLRDLMASFSEIANTDERINFVLASYNGGQGHVRDAMALTKKYGGDAHRWSDVRSYILKLAEPSYYRDPIVKYGYLRGSETANYVDAIRSHWTYYRTIVR